MSEHKRKSHKKRTAYLDVILNDATHILARRTTFSFFSLFSANNDIQFQLNAVCRMELQGQKRQFSLIANDPHPVWNEDATFSYPYADENSQKLNIEILDQENGLLTTEYVLLYKASIDLSEIPMDENVERNIELKKIDHPGELERKQKRPSFCQLYLHKSLDRKTGMLNYYGTPLQSIPIRVAVGDIILVNSLTRLASLGIQYATSSMWDHVGMVVKCNGKKNLRFFEATGEGVDVHYLNVRLMDYLEDNIVGIRRLKVQDKEMEPILATFVRDTCNRKFQTSPMHFLKTRRGTHEEEDLTFLFCSLLVAAALKRMKVIPDHIIPNNIMPAHFGEEEWEQESDAQIIHRILGPTIYFHPILNIMPSCSSEEEVEDHVYSVKVLSTETLPNLSTIFQIQVITEEGKGYEICKSFSEFVALDVAMKKLYTGTPKLPSNKKNGKKSSRLLTAKQQAIELYLELLLDDTVTHCSPVLKSFLSLHNKEELEDKIEKGA